MLKQIESGVIFEALVVTNLVFGVGQLKRIKETPYNTQKNYFFGRRTFPVYKYGQYVLKQERS